MTIMFRKSLVSMLGSLALVFALGGVAWAQDTMPTGSAQNMEKMGAMHSNMQNMHKDMHKKMMSMHMMPTTVTADDTTAGVVDGMAENIASKVHFPPKEMASL